MQKEYTTDKYYMMRALELALRGKFTAMPNPNVGCVIVNRDIIVGEGWHQRAGEPHAEVYALQMAGANAKDATAYITLEPCNHHGRMPPCCDALIAAGIKRVVVAMRDPNPHVVGYGLRRLQQAGIKVTHGIMKNYAKEINRGFLKRMRTGLPWIQVKFGASLDGKISMASGESKWITSSISRHDVQILRAQSSAIMTSSTTILIDNPSLTVRWKELDQVIYKDIDKNHMRQPLRIVIDGQQRVLPKHRLINQSGEIWLIRSKIDKYHWPKNVTQIVIPKHGEHLDLIAVMQLLGHQQINNVLVECGAKLAGALLENKLVDELIIYFAPKLLGYNANSLVMLPWIKNLSDALKLNFKDISRLGEDLKLTLTIC